MVTARMLLTVGVLALLASPAQASTISVTTVDDTVADDGLCSLREAVSAAGTNMAFHDCPAGSAVGGDTVSLPAGTYELTRTGASEDANDTGDLDVQDLNASPNSEGGDLHIEGVGAGATIIDAKTNDRAFDVRPDSLSGLDFTVKKLQIRNGTTPNVNTIEGDGGAILMRDDNGRLVIDQSTIKTSTASRWGGAVSFSNSLNGDSGSIVVIKSELIGNSAPQGGAIWSKNGGRGFTDDGGDVRVFQSALIGNTATDRGGALYLRGQTDGPGGTGANIVNSTIQGNSATNGGGAIAFGGSGTTQQSLEVAFSTISGNTATTAGRFGGIQTSAVGTGESVNFRGSIIAGNTTAGTGGDTNCGTTVNASLFAINGNGVSLGYNVESANTCGFTGTGDLTGKDAKLSAPANNGGDTRTMLIASDSPALNLVPPNFCKDTFGTALSVDQRGVTRPGLTNCDAGALEQADTDGDGILDIADNCPSTSNASQANLDGDALGDACDSDDDGDGVADGTDNCPSAANASQANVDGDSLGDACDPTDDRPAPGGGGTTTGGDGGTSGGGGSTGGGGTTADTTKPVISALRVGKTRITFTLSEAATVTFRVTKIRGGRLVKGRCVTPTKALRGKPRCDRRLAGSFTAAGVAGANSRRWARTLAGKPLPAGSYRLTATPKDAAGNNGAGTSALFTVS